VAKRRYCSIHLKTEDEFSAFTDFTAIRICRPHQN
jgi:hypothetical protein